MNDDIHHEDVELEKWFKSELEKPARVSPLKGIQQIEVTIVLSERAQSFDIKHDTLKSGVEKLLEEAGVKVVNRDTDHEIDEWGHAKMEIWVSLIPNPDRSAAYISVDVQDSAKLTRNQTSAYAIIWNAEVLFSYSDQNEMRQDISDKIFTFASEFIADYKGANVAS